MKRVSVSDAKNGLSGLIKEIQAGNPVIICDRGKPVARLGPVDTADLTDDEKSELLVQRGVVRPAKQKMTKEFLDAFLKRDIPKLPAGSSAVELLLEERRQGR